MSAENENENKPLFTDYIQSKEQEQEQQEEEFEKDIAIDAILLTETPTETPTEKQTIPKKPALKWIAASDLQRVVNILAAVDKIPLEEAVRRLNKMCEKGHLVIVPPFSGAPKK